MSATDGGPERKTMMDDPALRAERRRLATLSGEQPRKIEDKRYTKRGELFLDHDNGGYHNSYSVHDRGVPTGISIHESGHTKFKGGHEKRYLFGGKEWPGLREAIFAYEDAQRAKDTTP